MTVAPTSLIRFVAELKLDKQSPTIRAIIIVLKKVFIKNAFLLTRWRN